MSTEIDTRALAEEVAALIAKPTPALMIADQAAELLAVPKSWLMVEARAGRVPHVKLGKYTRFNRDELLAWVEGRSVGPRANGRAR